MFDETLGKIWYSCLLSGVLYNLTTIKWNSLPKILFLLNCVYRSSLPRIDASRHCFIDSYYSNVLYGRCLATLGEIGFVIEVNRLLDSSYRFSKNVERNNKLGFLVHVLCRNLLLISVIIAQCFCWLAIISGSNFYHVAEESIWIVMGLYLFVRSVIFTDTKREAIREFYINCTIITGLYIAYMFTMDVPMYLLRGFEDVNKFASDFTCKTVSMKISDFGLSAIQFIGYFIIGPQILENIVNMRKKINERMSFVV